MATLNWKTPNGTTGSIDLDKIFTTDGGKLTGNVTMSKPVPHIVLKDTEIARNTAPSSDHLYVEVNGKDKNDANTWGLYHRYWTTKKHDIALICYNGTTTDSAYTGIGVGYDSDGNVFTFAPTPSKNDTSTQIATTAFVKSAITTGTTNGTINVSGTNVAVKGLGSAAYTNSTAYAAASHGNHVPTIQTASNKIFLRNDNTWQTVTPANIGAAASGHNHDNVYIKELARGAGYVSHNSFKSSYGRTVIQWGTASISSTDTDGKDIPFNINFDSECTPYVIIGADTRAAATVKVYYDSVTYKKFIAKVTGLNSGGTNFRWVAFGY